MPEISLDVLRYGVLGLCFAVLVLAWRILALEQRREGEPRSGVVRFTWSLMAFSLILAVLSAGVQISEKRDQREEQGPAELRPQLHELREKNSQLLQANVGQRERLTATEERLRGVSTQLDESRRIAAILADSLNILRTALTQRERQIGEIRSTVAPLLNLRNSEVESLPDNLPQKERLRRILQELRQVLQ